MRRTRVKICGITTRPDAMAAIDAGADAIGLVFWQKSARYIGFDNAWSIRRFLPPTAAVVGVFVNPSVSLICEAVEKIGLTAVQICGRLNGEDQSTLPRSLTIIRSFAITGDKKVDAWKEMTTVSDYLLDNGSSGLHGGTGEVFDWQQALDFSHWGRIWLAGGLNPQNVGEAIRVVRPFAVDVSTGVETEPGKKSPQLIRDFVEAVHHADHALAREGHDAR